MAYALFTWILMTHVEFGGWAHWGYNAAVNLVAVKTLDNNGSGATSRAVAGINWVVSAATANGGRSVLVAGFRGRYSAQ
ncbi:hypothetical protein B9Z19DRAFT_1123311 [Tuber borchii]|uniref:Peptidase S54 rhomboid domain-containing protein n=1 Tax=Tuber borchii TaxID=42251 RepID=A0A2T6ZYV6_TUBBO|nr:hypothetical protein B9Z19DRAFT_1123311 [Tuber borchii]